MVNQKLITLLYLYKLLLIRRKKKNIRRKRRWWVRPINLDREQYGYYQKVFKKMKMNDPEEFFVQTRMTPQIFELLFSLLSDDLSKASFRPPICAESRLSLTLR